MQLMSIDLPGRMMMFGKALAGPELCAYSQFRLAQAWACLPECHVPSVQTRSIHSFLRGWRRGPVGLPTDSVTKS